MICIANFFSELKLSGVGMFIGLLVFDNWIGYGEFLMKGSLGI